LNLVRHSMGSQFSSEYYQVLIATQLPTPTLNFLPRDALVHSAVLRLHVVRPSVRPSVCL